jgi:hypothetical protein
MATKTKSNRSGAAKKAAPKVRDLIPGKNPKGGAPLNVKVKVTRKPAD